MYVHVKHTAGQRGRTRVADPEQKAARQDAYRACRLGRPARATRRKGAIWSSASGTAPGATGSCERGLGAGVTRGGGGSSASRRGARSRGEPGRRGRPQAAAAAPPQAAPATQGARRLRGSVPLSRGQPWILRQAPGPGDRHCADLRADRRARQHAAGGRAVPERGPAAGADHSRGLSRCEPGDAGDHRRRAAGARDERHRRAALHAKHQFGQRG